MRRLFTRIVVLLVTVEVVYLAFANAVLNLPVTQDYLNGLKPERFAVQWERAWSWYPFTVHVTGLSLNGQTWSQQWQVSGPRAKASLALLPLFDKTISVYDLDTADIDVRFRPRPSPDRDDAAVSRFYPTIEGRDPSLAAEPAPTRKPGWLVLVDIERIGGHSSFWIWRTKGTLAGQGRAKVMRQTGHGPLAISDGMANISVGSLTIDGRQISDGGSIEGKFEFASFVPHENRGVKSLAFLSTDAEIDLPLKGLDFLDFYLGKVSGMKLGGDGTVKGRFAYARGDLIAGADLAITADGVTIAQEPYLLSGAGNVDVKVTSAKPNILDAKFSFDTLNVSDQTRDQALFTGSDLAVTVERSARILPGGGEQSEHRHVVVNIPKMTVPDLSTYHRFLPDKWNVQLLAGTGTLDGRAEMSAAALIADLQLSSDNAEILMREESFESSLLFDLKLEGEASAATARVDISGTSLSLKDSQLKNQRGKSSDIWHARLVVNEGVGEFELPVAASIDQKRAGCWGLFRKNDLNALLATLDGEFGVDASVSDLAWLNILFKNPFALAVRDSAEIEADLIVRSGSFVEGSTLKMRPQDFEVEFLDYVAKGNGGFNLTAEKGGDRPDLRLEAQLSNASLKLRDEEKAVIDQAMIAVVASAKGVSFKGGGTVSALDLSVSSAKISDMSAYNHYLPKGSPLRLLGGEADLSANLELETDSASGFVKLRSSRVDAVLDDQPLFGTLALDVEINDGTVRDMDFDISGSSLRIDDVRIAGEGSNIGDEAWSGRIDLSKGGVVWKKPMKLDFDAKIEMTDTWPLVTLFENHAKRHRWLEKILTLKNVRGNASINVQPDEFLVPYALAKSDTIEIGAKGFIREDERQGIFFARYGKLAGALEFNNGKRKFNLIGATKKFEEYVPGE
jgi:hypothetical protein